MIIDYAVLLILLISIIFLSLILYKKNKEGYCADISGGFKTCDCQGNCAFDKN